eukprot:gene20727-28954_t
MYLVLKLLSLGAGFLVLNALDGAADSGSKVILGVDHPDPCTISVD